MLRLTGSRARVLRALVEAGGRASLRELARRASISAAQALYHVIELERMGVVARRGGEVELLEFGRQVAKLLEMMGASRIGLVEALALPRLTAHIYLSENRAMLVLATALLLATWVVGMARIGSGALMGLYVSPLLGFPSLGPLAYATSAATLAALLVFTRGPIYRVVPSLFLYFVYPAAASLLAWSPSAMAISAMAQHVVALHLASATALVKSFETGEQFERAASRSFLLFYATPAIILLTAHRA